MMMIKMGNTAHIARLGVTRKQFEDAYTDPEKIAIRVDSERAVYEAKTQDGERITIVFGFNANGSTRPITAHKKDNDPLLRKKIWFPWEIPDLKTEEEARDFWDTHEVTDELLKYSLASEIYDVQAGGYTVQIMIENIPAIREWDLDGKLLSSRYEMHIEESLRRLKERASEGVHLYADKINRDRKVRIDFESRKIVLTTPQPLPGSPNQQ